MKSANTIYTVGYGQWTTKQRMERPERALTSANITTLIDVRIIPCSSQVPPSKSKNYLPKPWHLQAEDEGIIPALRNIGVEYRWLGELGNPQKNDPAMAILREQIASKGLIWPVNRGLALLRKILVDDSIVCCLMCACKNYDDCHRKLIAEAIIDESLDTPSQTVDLSK